jgi:hypothetical protein
MSSLEVTFSSKLEIKRDTEEDKKVKVERGFI